MNKIKDIAKEAVAVLTIAALTVATTGSRVMAVGLEDEGGGGTGDGAAATGRAQQGVDSVNPGAAVDLNGMIRIILNTVFTVVGIVAVVMIVIGGVNYTTSQGDSQKVQKAKNTIMYGIIGLIIVLLAFAIVNFVLNSLMGA